MKNVILIDTDNFIKKHFITKEKSDLSRPKKSLPPWPVIKSSQEGWAATNKKNSDVWECAELSAAQCSHPPPAHLHPVH